jgi:hypothetical protein
LEKDMKDNEAELGDIIADYESRLALMREAELARRMIEKQKWQRVNGILRELVVLIEAEI